MKSSWLQSPAVAMIELLASVIAIVQTLAWLCRIIHKLQTEAKNERYRRVRMTVAVAALLVTVALSAMTWPVLIAEAAKSGDRGSMGVLDTLEFAFLGIFAAQILLKEAWMRERFSPYAYCLLTVTLVTVATAYSFSSGSASWVGASLTGSSSDLAIVALAYLLVRHSGRIGRQQAKRNELPAAAERA
jgi:cell division protein FtsW (lipid II flippase)